MRILLQVVQKLLGFESSFTDKICSKTRKWLYTEVVHPLTCVTGKWITLRLLDVKATVSDPCFPSQLYFDGLLIAASSIEK